MQSHLIKTYGEQQSVFVSHAKMSFSQGKNPFQHKSSYAGVSTSAASDSLDHFKSRQGSKHLNNYTFSENADAQLRVTNATPQANHKKPLKVDNNLAQGVDRNSVISPI